MASSILLLLLLLPLLLFSLCASLPQETVLDAADILADSGYVSMSLTLEVLSQTFLSQHSSLTIFAPSDSSFRKSGQPPLNLLKFHFSPLPLPPQSLRLLPTGAEIPTLLDNHSLMVTASRSDRGISINNVKIRWSSPIYDDGFFLIYGIDRFFDPNFQYNPPSQRHGPNPSCRLRNHSNVSSSDSFEQAIETLESSGYSVTASFLGLQLNGIRDGAAMTIFAPADEMVENFLGNFSEYPSFFLRHVVPCKLLWNDLVNFKDGSELPTFLEGFSINVTRSGGILMLNRVPVFFPDIHYNDKLVVHGVGDVLVALQKTQEVAESFPGKTGKPVEEIGFDPGEF